MYAVFVCFLLNKSSFVNFDDAQRVDMRTNVKSSNAFSHARTWSLKRWFSVYLMVFNFSVAWKLKKLDIHINIHFNLLCHVILLCFASFLCPLAYRQLLCAIRQRNTGGFETSMYDCLQCLEEKKLSNYYHFLKLNLELHYIT